MKAYYIRKIIKQNEIKIQKEKGNDEKLLIIEGKCFINVKFKHVGYT